MANPVDDIFAQAMTLTPEERLRLADRILDTVDLAHEGFASAEVAAAWDAEIRSRLESIERGDARLIPLDEALGAMFKRQAHEAR